MKATFYRTEWDDVGEDAWALRGTSDAYTPTTGFGVCHDFFEHNCQLDTIQDEIMAHGAMYRLRWETGYVYRDGYDGKPDSIGYEWENLLRGMLDACLDEAPRTTKLDDHVETDLEAIIQEGFRVAKDYDEHNEQDDDIQALRRNYAGWFRKGYRWAQNHYKCGAEVAAYNGFNDLERELEELEKQELQHGDQLEVEFNPRTAELSVTLKRQCAYCMAYANAEDFLCDDCQEAEEEVY